MPSEQEQNNLAIIHIPRPFPHVRFAFSNVVIIFICYQIATMLLMYIAGGLDIDRVDVWAQGLGNLLFMLLPTIAVMRYSPLERRELLRTEGDVHAEQWLLGLGGILPMLLVGNGWMVVQESLMPGDWLPVYRDLQESVEGLYESLLVGHSVPAVFGAYMVGAVIPAFAEEILFRGLMQRSLEEVWSPLRAIAVTGVVFGLIHFNPVATVPLILLGMYFGVLAWYTRSLALPIAVHFCYNAVSITALNIAARQQAATTGVDQAPLWQGAVMTVVGLLLLALLLRRLFLTRRLLRPLRRSQ